MGVRRGRARPGARQRAGHPPALARIVTWPELGHGLAEAADVADLARRLRPRAAWALAGVRQPDQLWAGGGRLVAAGRARRADAARARRRPRPSSPARSPCCGRCPPRGCRACRRRARRGPRSWRRSMPLPDASPRCRCAASRSWRPYRGCAIRSRSSPTAAASSSTASFGRPGRARGRRAPPARAARSDAARRQCTLRPARLAELEQRAAWPLLAGEAELCPASGVGGRSTARSPAWSAGCPSTQVEPLRARLGDVGSAVVELPRRAGGSRRRCCAPARARPFRPLVDTYGPARYRDVDPTAFAAVDVRPDVRDDVRRRRPRARARRLGAAAAPGPPARRRPGGRCLAAARAGRALGSGVRPALRRGVRPDGAGPARLAVAPRRPDPAARGGIGLGAILLAASYAIGAATGCARRAGRGDHRRRAGLAGLPALPRRGLRLARLAARMPRRCSPAARARRGRAGASRDRLPRHSGGGGRGRGRDRASSCSTRCSAPAATRSRSHDWRRSA